MKLFVNNADPRVAEPEKPGGHVEKIWTKAPVVSFLWISFANPP
jgi:hypothetical protein